MLEEKILKLSKNQRVNLPAIIDRARTQNFPGVKFTSKPAYFFVKDCVDISDDYVPMVIYNTIENPISKLKGKVSKAEVEEFVNKATPQSSALLKIMLFDIQKMGISISTTAVVEKVEHKKPQPTADAEVYGVYGMMDDEVDIVIEEEKPMEEEPKYDVSNANSIIKTLCEVLEAK